MTRSGQVWTWGSNARGQLGRQQEAGTQGDVALGASGAAAVGASDGKGGGSVAAGAPMQVAFPQAGVAPVIQVACGVTHTLALTSSGKVYGWGGNANQCLGLPDASVHAEPVEVPGLPPCSSVAASGVSAAISRVSRPCRGAGQGGQMGGEVERA